MPDETAVTSITPSATPPATPPAQRPATAEPRQRLSFDVDTKHLLRHNIFVNATDEQSKIAISAYKSLRTHMLREMEAHSAQSLVVTGTTAGVGKSVTAANLAINIARHREKRVLLVDLDLRAPTIAKMFGFKPHVGIDQIDASGRVFPAAVVYPDIQNLSILPCVTGHQDSAELLMSSRMRSLLQVLRNYRDDTVVIFDAPPILGCDDVAAIMPIMDLCLVVVSEAETSRGELTEAMNILGDVPVASVLLNKASSKFFGNYYY